MAYLDMDLHDTPDTMGFDPIPAGDYVAQIIESDIGTSKKGYMMLNLTWVIMDGPYAERLVFDRVMLSGSDASIAFGKNKIKTIASATGHHNPNRVNDSEELHGRPCSIIVTIREWDGENRNEVKNYKPLTTQALSAPAPQSTPPQASTPPPVRPTPPPPSHSQAPPPPAQGQPPARTVPPAQGAGAPPRPQTPFDPPSE